jgi:hypothetical protein
MQPKDFEDIPSLIRYCNPSALRVDFHLESRSHEFGFRNGREFKEALSALKDTGSLARLSFDNDYAVCVAASR